MQGVHQRAGKLEISMRKLKKKKPYQIRPETNQIYCCTAAVGGAAYCGGYVEYPTVPAGYCPNGAAWFCWYAHKFAAPVNPRLWKNLLLMIDSRPLGTPEFDGVCTM